MNRLQEKEQRYSVGKRKVFLAAFVLIHTLAYILVGTVYHQVLQLMPADSRTALDFFQLYEPLSGQTFVSQVIRGSVIGAVCLPLMETILISKKPWLMLTGVLWGIGIFGSVEPLPGSFEGMLYTTTTAPEHTMALAATLIQTLIMAGILTKWFVKLKAGLEVSETAKKEHLYENDHEYYLAKEFLRRFTLLHVSTYWIVGILFYQLSGYQEALATMEVFSLWRPLENMVMPFMIFFGQFIRGTALAALLMPFQHRFFRQAKGGVVLFTTLWGMTFLGAVNIVPWVVQDFLIGGAPYEELLVGPPEVTVQILLFTVGLYLWQRRTISAAGFKTGRDVRPARVDSR